MTGAEVARFEGIGVPEVDLAVRRFGMASFCPASYRQGGRDDGAPNYPDLVIAGASLHALHVDVFNNLAATYVVHRRFGMMAALQNALAQREGVYVEIEDSSATSATVRLRQHRGEAGHVVTVTMAEAVQAGWTKRNPCYQTMPRQMLEARATTAAIRAYAPGVLTGIASRLHDVAPLDLDGAPAISAGAGNPPATMAPALAEYLTRPAPDDLRRRVFGRLVQLREVDQGAYTELRDEWKALRGPVMQVTADNPTPHPALLPDWLVLDYMLDEAEGALRASGVVVHESGPTPDAVRDDAPESRGMDPDAEQEYADDDPARPF